MRYKIFFVHQVKSMISNEEVISTNAHHFKSYQINRQQTRIRSLLKIEQNTCECLPMLAITKHSSWIRKAVSKSPKAKMIYKIIFHSIHVSTLKIIFSYSIFFCFELVNNFSRVYWSSNLIDPSCKRKLSMLNMPAEHRTLWLQGPMFSQNLLT